MNLNFPPKLNLKLSITKKRQYKALFFRTRQFFTIWDITLAGNSNSLLAQNNLPLLIKSWLQESNESTKLKENKNEKMRSRHSRPNITQLCNAAFMAQWAFKIDLLPRL